MNKGLIVATDSQIEWLLPWWWSYYSRYNDFPVRIVDFGMTPKMRRWAEKRGEVVSLNCPKDFLRRKEILSPEITKQWESTYKGDVWQAREAWFKKPLACLESPFDLTVWMDIDCEVLGSLKPLFDEWEEGIELALVRDERCVEENNYSSGVILFAKDAPFLKTWTAMCLSQNGKYMGDQNALTDLLLTGQVSFKELNPIYNWIMYQGYNMSALVAHWGSWGKEYIQRFGGIHDLLGK